MYLGDCTTILDDPDSPFSDASEMACAIENSREVTMQKFLDQAGQSLHESLRVQLEKDCFSFGVTTEKVLWAWNEDTDVHYFYEWESSL